MSGTPEIDLELLRRYDRPGPRYTSYPTAVEFHDGYGAAEYRAKLAEADTRVDEPLSVYVHLPFCTERCHYCGCNVVITKKTEIAARYLEYLHREIDLLARHLPNRRRVSQLHWGGGTPTYLDPRQMEALHAKLDEHFELEPDAEVAVEVDPRVTTSEQLRLLRELGFNRISIGVQDLTPEVQEAIGRHQTVEQTLACNDRCRELGFDSVNFDLVYGLPCQTLPRFRTSMDLVAGMRPDRLAIYSYAHVPWIRAHQKKMDSADLPNPETKLQLFSAAREMLLAAGYRAIGMDHFALPGDELVEALADRRLHRNFMGYTVKLGFDMLGLGVSAIGDVQASYAQNVRKLSLYYKALDADDFPVERGYELDADDCIRRAVIMQLMCNAHLKKRRIEKQFGIRFDQYFSGELERLCASDGPAADGLVRQDAERIDVTDKGRLFVRNIAMEFDRYLPQRKEKPYFSRTV